MQEYIEKFKDRLKGKRARNTIYVYLQAIKRFNTFLEKENISYNKIPKDIMDLFIDFLVKQGCNPNTIHTWKSAVWKYLKFLRNSELIKIPELIEGIAPNWKRPIPFVLAEKVLLTYLQVAKKVPEPYSTALRLAPLCGLRVEELCRVKQEDIEIVDNEYILINVPISKEEKGRKTVLLSAGNLILRDYFIREKEMLDKTIWLFPLPKYKNKHINSPMLRKYLKEIKVELGIENLTPHTLRRTYMSILNARGVTLATIAGLSGHADTKTTMLYINPLTPDLRKAVKGFAL